MHFLLKVLLRCEDEVNDYDGTNDKPEKNIWTLYGSSWDHVIIEYRYKNADKN